MKNGTLHRSMLTAVMLLAATALALAISCAPASNDAGMSMDMGEMEVDESNLKLKIGEQTPPFAMILADGTEVSSAELADQSRPAHLFWFATW